MHTLSFLRTEQYCSQTWLSNDMIFTEEPGVLKVLGEAKSLKDYTRHSSGGAGKDVCGAPLAWVRNILYIFVPIVAILLKVIMTRGIFSNRHQISQHLMCFYTSH